MIIVADLSLYPLKEGPIPEIIGFIKELQQQDGIEIVTNQLSTQLRGDFEAVTHAINHCMKNVMMASNTVVLVVKYLNVDLDQHLGEPAVAEDGPYDLALARSISELDGIAVGYETNVL